MNEKDGIPDQQKNLNLKLIFKKEIIAWLIIMLAVMGLYFMLNKNSNEKSLDTAPIFKKQGELTFQKKDGKSIVTIDIEIADDDNKREIGMMGRPVMEERQGMLFVLEQEQMATFWMRNCILPLDMIFISKVGEIVTICENTTPFSDQTYSATALTLFVLEVNAGFADKHGIKVGDRIGWKRTQ
jgi:uncharacterized membrane protein (UPF0127 family)